MGSTITAETIIDGNTTTYIEYFYDSYGAYGFSINGTFYYYIKNLQGDVTQIRDENNNLIASYVYDAWGKILNITEYNNSDIGAKNAIRYRGYYYDTESNLYYLNARYYDPQVKRFLNPDAILGANGGLVGYNMYAYCNNNPIIYTDYSGNKIVTTVLELGGATRKHDKYLILNGHEYPSRPFSGDPNSKYESPNGDWRQYDENGNPLLDYDHDDHGNPKNHPHDENGGHYHKWKDGKRGNPSDKSEFSWKAVGGGALVFVCVIAVIVIAADDSTGIGVVDDFLFGPLGAGITTGLKLITG